MPVTNFPAEIAHGKEAEYPLIHEFDVLSTEAFKPGAFVFFDTADNNVKECGADPALILGIALGAGPASTVFQRAPSPYALNKVPIAILTPDVVVKMASGVAVSLAHLLRPFGIEKTTNWRLDTTDAGNTRLTVVKLDITQGIAYCRFLAANLQGDAVVS